MIFHALIIKTIIYWLLASITPLYCRSLLLPFGLLWHVLPSLKVKTSFNFRKEDVVKK